MSFRWDLSNTSSLDVCNRQISRQENIASKKIMKGDLMPFGTPKKRRNEAYTLYVNIVRLLSMDLLVKQPLGLDDNKWIIWLMLSWTRKMQISTYISIQIIHICTLPYKHCDFSNRLSFFAKCGCVFCDPGDIWCAPPMVSLGKFSSRLERPNCVHILHFCYFFPPFSVLNLVLTAAG